MNVISDSVKKQYLICRGSSKPQKRKTQNAKRKHLIAIFDYTVDREAAGV
jgi:hypothetical protein